MGAAFEPQSGTAAQPALRPDSHNRVRSTSTSVGKASEGSGHPSQAPAGVGHPAAPAGTTREQKMAALAKANRIRRDRSRWKKRLQREQPSKAMIDALELLSLCPDWVATWSAEGLLSSVPFIGDYRAHRALIFCRIPNLTTIAELTTDQRAALQAWLAERAEILAA